MATQNYKGISSIKRLIDKSNNITLISHNNPDGDAVGSLCGLAQVLSSANKVITKILPNKFPNFLNWVPGANDILFFEDNPKEIENNILTTELIICLDFNVPNRLKAAEILLNIAKCPIILIDHHPEPDTFFKNVISDTSVSSTAELVYEVLLQTNYLSYLNKEGAESLFAGIVTDTIVFTVNSSRKRSFEIISELLTFNLDKEAIINKLFNNYSESRMRLLGHILNKKMVVLPQHKAAYISLSRKEAYKYNFEIGDSEGFVNYPLQIKGIVFSAFFMERKDHIKLSFRSKGNFPANEVMMNHFSGGGHKNAAGGEIKNMTLDEATKLFESILPLYSDLCKEE